MAGVESTSTNDRPADVTYATILTVMSISPKSVFDIEKCPFYVTEDGQGKAVTDLFA